MAIRVSGGVSSAWYVLRLDLDGGPLLLSDRPAVLSGQPVIPAVLAWSDVSATASGLEVEAAALPPRLGFWVRRRAVLYEVESGADSLGSARILLAGIVEEEPEETGGKLSVRLGPPRLTVRRVPDGAPITAAVWPRAVAPALGAVPPEVFGRVESCPLLPVQQPAYTTLAADAAPGQTALTVTDASRFPASGTVSVDGQRYSYSSRTDAALLGVTAAAHHRSGTCVAEAGAAVYLAAASVSAIDDIRAGGVPVPGASVDTATGLVRFEALPTTQQTEATQELLAQFDGIGPTSTAINGFNAIRAAADPGPGETNPQTQSAATGGSYPVVLDVPVSYTPGTRASGQTPAVWQPLALSVPLPNGVLAGTYTFTVLFDDKTDPTLSHRTTVTVGGVAQVLDGTKPMALTFDVPLSAGQSVLSVSHSQFGGAWPADCVAAVMDVTIKSLSGTVRVSDGRPTGVSGSSEIVFPRPAPVAGTDKIIAGAYRVSYAVAVDPQVVQAGVATVSIGSTVVWVWDSGNVVYARNPAVIQQDDNTDRLAVSVQTDTAQAGAFAVSVTAAERTVLLGNLDSGTYATLRKPANTVLSVRQTTDMADRGKIQSAQLIVDFWSKAQAIDAVHVFMDGVRLGQLSFATDATVAGGTVSKTIAVDTVGSVGAALRTTSAVGSMVTQPANYSSPLSVTTVVVPVSYVQSGATSGAWFGCNKPLRQMIPLPPGTVAQRLIFGVTFGSMGGMSSTGNSTVTLGGQSIAPEYDRTRYVEVDIPAGATAVELTHQHIFGTSYGLPGAEPMITNVSYSVQVNPQFGLTGGGFSGSPQVGEGGAVNVQPFTPVAKVSGVAGSGNLTFDVPGDSTPRAAKNVFDLPMAVLGWHYFTGREVKLIYTGGDSTNAVHITQVQLAIQFAPVISTPAPEVTATVTGRSGNPADVLRFLAAAAGETVAPLPWQRLRQWADATGYRFARRLSEARDATTLLAEAARAALVQVAATPGGRALVRRLDEGGPCTVIPEEDLMDDARISWVSPSDLYNDLLVRYRHIGGAPTQAVARGPDTADRWARRSVREIGGRQAMEITDISGWIADAATAERFAADWLRLNAPMRRLLTLALPFTYAALQEGDLIEVAPQGIPARVMTKTTDESGFISVTAEEIPQP